jgi:hypothetical protein
VKLDLAAVAGQIMNGPRGKVRALWEGGQLEIDEVAFVGRLANAVATVMGQNLFRGDQPDGSGAMPGRKLDGRPRGMGAAIARALAAVQTGPLEWTIAAHKEIQGHLARIMREVPLRPPPFDRFAVAIRMAFERSVKVGELGRAIKSGAGRFGRALKFGITARPQRFGRMVDVAGARDVFKGFGSFGRALRPRVRSTSLGRAVRGQRARGGR